MLSFYSYSIIKNTFTIFTQNGIEVIEVFYK